MEKSNNIGPVNHHGDNWLKLDGNPTVLSQSYLSSSASKMSPNDPCFLASTPYVVPPNTVPNLADLTNNSPDMIPCHFHIYVIKHTVSLLCHLLWRRSAGML